jgi:hypothetical protein
MRNLWLICICVGCGPATTPTAESATEAPSEARATCTATYDIASTPGTRYEDVATEAVIPWPVEGVTFAATVTRVGDVARIEGVLTNTTDAEVSVDYLTGGVMGLSTNPFQITVVGEVVTATGPEIYPTPRRAILPPHGTMTYRSDRCPASFPATIQWTFSPWTGDAVHGEQALP